MTRALGGGNNSYLGNLLVCSVGDAGEEIIAKQRVKARMWLIVLIAWGRDQK